MTETPPLPSVENASARQAEIPFAVVRGEPFYELPKDLYIPPDALEVILEAFEGPLDLLLYLIRRQNLDILDIPIAAITRQYIGYIEMMQELRFELAAEYLVMAAILAEIKSRLLLPRPPVDIDEEADPRAELVRRLQEYERFKKAAEDIEALPRMERDTCAVSVHVPERKVAVVPPEVELRELLLAFRDVLNRADLFVSHQIRREPLSVRQKMTEVLDALSSGEFREFSTLFTPAEGRLGVVVCFLALLELGKAGLIEIVQDRPLAPIYLKSLALREPDA
ncbi:MAG: segregation/condensation protein A [Rhodanobacteraceae bacterium]|nr:segregation/condensation protein A [Rhodanobacteraceae bacterium]